MGLLVDISPVTVTIDNIEYNINSNFRTFILFEQLMFDEDFPENLKTIKALQLVYPEIPSNVDKAIEKMIWFYSCGKPQKSKNSRESGTRCYDFEFDDSYIFAAFWQSYGIDLESKDYLHWWKFRALFRALPDDCEFVKIMCYRSIKIDNKMSNSQKQFYSKMKKLYALPRSKSENEKINEIEKMLMRK